MAVELVFKKSLSLIDQFKAFAFKGNVIDLAVGVIIGAAFSKIISSLVDNIIMPLVGVVLPGEKGYLGWVVQVQGKEIPYGLFIGDIVNFLIVSAVLFVVIVKLLGFLTQAKAPDAVPLSKSELLLIEIRDLLAKESSTKS